MDKNKINSPFLC